MYRGTEVVVIPAPCVGGLGDGGWGTHLIVGSL